MNRFFESLESREFMSAAPTHTPVQAPPSIVADVTAGKTVGAHVSAAQQANIKKLANDLKAIQAKSGVTTEQIDALKTDLAAVALVATRPSKDLVKALITDLKAAAADKTISLQEKLQLTADVQAVLVSANVPVELATALASDVQAIVTATNITSADVKLIAGDLKAIFSTFTAAHPGHA